MAQNSALSTLKDLAEKEVDDAHCSLAQCDAGASRLKNS